MSIKVKTKSIILEAKKIRIVQKRLKAKSEQEAVEILVQREIDNARIDRSHRRLVEKGSDIQDVFGRLNA